MVHTMRWFGPNDPVSLNDLRQAGCTGVVTSLHQHPAGVVWTVDEIIKRKNLIEKDNTVLSPLHWAVVESVLIHDDIKRGLPSRDRYIETFQQTIHNLAACSIHTICYNFMPVLDWTRTDVKFRMPDGSLALRFVWEDFALFDICILKRPDAEKDYTPAIVEKVWEKFEKSPPEIIQDIKATILMGLPGTGEKFELESFKKILLEYKYDIGEKQLRENLYYFLRKVAPVAEEVGSRLCIHPDDPPLKLMGLPRVVSTEKDLTAIVNAVKSPANGITFCTGSLGARVDNDLPGIVKRLGSNIHFIHLRSVKSEQGTSNFYEANHLEGNVDMYAVIREIIVEQQRRKDNKETIVAIPMRPDHGHQMLDDLKKNTYPGYSAIGRLRGLAEIRGVETAIVRMLTRNKLIMMVQPLFDISIEHGEGPVWDIATNKLYWVDLMIGDIYSGDIMTGKICKKSISQPLGSVALREKGGILVAAHQGFGFTDLKEDTQVDFFNNPQPAYPETRFNDGKVDPLGNFVAGTMTFDGKKDIGNVFLLKPDKNVICLENNLLLSNGIDWSPDGTKCYLADTNAHVVYSYDYIMDNGTLSNRKNFIDFNGDEWPDGLCVDTEGNLWIAMWGGSCIIKFDKNGKKIKAIELPVTHPTSCCFGGDDLSTLFITTSKLVLSDAERTTQPLAGKILTMQTGSKGQMMGKFKG